MRTSEARARARDNGDSAAKLNCRAIPPCRRSIPRGAALGKLVPVALSLQYRAVDLRLRRATGGQIALPSTFASTQPEISQSPFDTRRKL
jgi:hypothetical protein